MLYPKNPRSWWKVYRKMLKDHQKEVDEDAAKLKAAFDGIKADRKQHQSRVIAGVPHIPKLDGMQFAHAAEYNRIKKPKKDTRPLRTTQSLMFGSVTTKTLTGRGVMDKVRRQAMEKIRRERVMSTPTHQLSGLASRVLEAPKHMVEQYQKPPSPKPLDPTIPKPVKFQPPTPSPRVENRPRNGATTTEERERRLRALTNPNSAVKAATATNPTAPSKRPSTASSILASGNTLKSKAVASTDRAQLPVPSVPSSAGLKRKAEEAPILPSTEANGFGSLRSQNPATGSPRPINVSRLKTASPEISAPRLQKKKATADIFMPVKKRRLV